ncbi:MAG: hypothetical protein GW905_07735 [Rhodobacterales bacterium]|nr:hypothetical protein [Rhodobacterales bacterium]
MTNIDFMQLVTATEMAALAANARAAALKSVCAARILAVLDERTLLNVQGAVLAGELDPAEMDVFRAGRSWVTDMQDACRTATDNDPLWPDLPDSVAALAARF